MGEGDRRNTMGQLSAGWKQHSLHSRKTREAQLRQTNTCTATSVTPSRKDEMASRPFLEPQ